MTTDASQLLQLAKLQARQGNLTEARASLGGLLQKSIQTSHPMLWLESARTFLHCSQELEDLGATQCVMEDVQEFLKKTHNDVLMGQAEILIGAWLLALGKIDQAQTHVESALKKSTQAMDLSTIARSLTILGHSYSMKPETYNLAIQQFDKAEVILREINNAETSLTVKLLRGFIYTQQLQYDLALSLLWEGYEQAKLHSFNLIVASILAQIARIHRDQKRSELFTIYSELALKGLDPLKSPRLYKTVLAMCPPNPNPSHSQYDFKIDEFARVAQEKSKGTIDFKNQHILFDLALLFIKNAGSRFSKEDLVSKIWGQIYAPATHDNLIYVSIKRLRTLLEPDFDSPRYILRDRKGYYFNPQSTVKFKEPEEASL